MENDIIGAVSAFLAGTLICFGNYKLSEYFIRHKPEKYSLVSILTQFIRVSYFLLLYFTADYTPWSKMYILIGGALGVTLPMLLFTHRLIKVNKEGSADKKEKEESDNG